MWEVGAQTGRATVGTAKGKAVWGDHAIWGEALIQHQLVPEIGRILHSPSGLLNWGGGFSV